MSGMDEENIAIWTFLGNEFKRAKAMGTEYPAFKKRQNHLEWMVAKGVMHPEVATKSQVINYAHSIRMGACKLAKSVWKKLQSNQHTMGISLCRQS